jgi:elongation factor 1-alpha
MEREKEEGNIEYKLMVKPNSKERLEELATQLMYRINEGGGEAFYELGVSNDGQLLGLNEEEARQSFEAMDKICEMIGATYIVVRKERGKRGDVYELLVRRSRDVPPIMMNLVLLGNVDAGKSTLKGVLVTGKLDDGNGSAMSAVARYPHELRMRRSSSVSIHILGFDNKGNSVNDSIPYNEPEIYMKSSKLVNLIDLAGHFRYLKTTLRGVLGSLPDYALLVVGANAGIIGSFKEHLGIAIALGIPVVIVMTKIDATPREVAMKNLRDVIKILKLPGINRIPIIVRELNDAAVAARYMTHGKIVPIFLVSNVTGQGLSLLKSFLNMLPPRVAWKERAKKGFLCYIDQKYIIPGAGLVVAGLVEYGSVSEGDQVLLGPFDDGSFKTVRVRSIQVNRLPVSRAVAGEMAGFAITGVDQEDVRRGMVLLGSGREVRATWKFKAEIKVLHHPTTIRVGYEPVIHVHTIKQTSRLIKSSKEYMRTGDSGEVVFKFLHRPEYILKGDVFIFREGTTRGIGRVLELL